MIKARPPHTFQKKLRRTCFGLLLLCLMPSPLHAHFKEAKSTSIVQEVASTPLKPSQGSSQREKVPTSQRATHKKVKSKKADAKEKLKKLKKWGLRHKKKLIAALLFMVTLPYNFLFLQNCLIIPAKIFCPLGVPNDPQIASFKTQKGVKQHYARYRYKGGDLEAFQDAEKFDHIILFFPGNAEGVFDDDHYFPFPKELAYESKLPVFSPCYQGLWDREEDFYRKIDAFYDHIVKTRLAQGGKITVIGRSLGGAAAVHVAKRTEVDQLMTASAFAKLPDVIENILPSSIFWLFKGFFAYTLDNEAKLAEVTCTVTVMHGTADELIPFDHAQRLLEVATGPKEKIDFPEKGHNNCKILPDILKKMKLYDC